MAEREFPLAVPCPPERVGEVRPAGQSSGRRLARPTHSRGPRRWRLVLWVLLLAGGPLAASPPGLLHEVTVENRTGFDLHFLYFSPGDSDLWGPDILGSRGVLSRGEAARFFVSLPDAGESFDLLAMGRARNAYELRDLRVPGGGRSRIVLRFDHFSGVGPSFVHARLQLRNLVPEAIRYAFFSPRDSGVWGVDLLGRRRVLATGAILEFLVPVARFRTGYDVLAVGASGRWYQFGVEVSRSRDFYRWAIEPTDAVDPPRRPDPRRGPPESPEPDRRPEEPPLLPDLPLPPPV